MYLANIFINNGSSDEYIVQVWDMDSKQEKIILYLEDETLLENESLARIIANSVYDKYSFRIVTAIIVNPAEMAIDAESFDEIYDEGLDRGLLFDVTIESKTQN
jgi:hypothetical protein